MPDAPRYVQAVPIDPPPRVWFWTFGVGRHHVRRGYSYALPPRSNVLGAHLLFLTLKGGGEYAAGGRRFTVRADALTLLPGLRRPTSWRCAGDEWLFYWLVLKGPGPIGWCRQFGIGPTIRAAPLGAERVPPLVDRLDALIDLARGAGGARSLAVQREGLALFAALIEATRERPTGHRGPRVHGQDVLQAVERYLRRPDPSPDRVDELAAELRASPEHVARVLRAATGFAPKDYFLRHRVAQAQQLLRETRLPIGDIGRRVGYADPYHFSRLFRRRVGVSPMGYRRRGGVF